MWAWQHCPACGGIEIVGIYLANMPGAGDVVGVCTRCAEAEREADRIRRGLGEIMDRSKAQFLDHLRSRSLFDSTPAQTEFVWRGRRHRRHTADFTTLALLDDAVIHAELNRWQAADGWRAPR